MLFVFLVLLRVFVSLFPFRRLCLLFRLRMGGLFLPVVQRRMHVVHPVARLLRRSVAVIALLLLLLKLLLLRPHFRLWLSLLLVVRLNVGAPVGLLRVVSRRLKWSETLPRLLW